MVKASENVLMTIGGTPVVRLSRVVPAGHAAVHLKLEHLSPTGSTKDRIAAALIDRLAPGVAVVAASSGSLGISLAMVCALKGHALTIVIPDAMTLERRAALRTYGVKLELTRAELGMRGAYERAAQLAESMGESLLDQRSVDDAVRIHAETTGRELMETARADGGIDAFVCGVGTGATLKGIARVLKVSAGKALVVTVKPSATRHRIQGLESEFEPAPADRVLTVSDRDAWEMKGRLGREEGLLVGISTGANVCAAIAIAQELGPGRRVYTLAMDTGERYFSLAEQFK